MKISWILTKLTPYLGVLLTLILAIYGFTPTVMGCKNDDPFLSFVPPFDSAINAASHYHLGAEYWCTAKSIVDGRGYSSPFGIPSGPSAWTPPLLPAILAFIWYASNRSESTIVWIYVTINATIFSWVMYDLLRMTHFKKIKLQWISLLSVGCVLISSFYDNFQRTHDGPFLLLVFHWACRQLMGWERWSYIKWGATGGLASLLSPVITFVWVVASTSLIFCCKGGASTEKAITNNKLRGFIIAGCVSLSLHGPWLIRNSLQFGRFIPIKSNGFFELEQSLLRDDDGVIDFGHDLQHPFSSSAEAEKHASIGETAYIEERVSRLRNEFWNHGWRYLLHCRNRFCAATVFFIPIFPEEEYGTWIIITRVLYALPWSVFVSSIAIAKPLSREQKIALVCMVSFLIPYILVSYYGRYLVPLAGARCLLLIWGLQRWLDRS